MPVRAPHRDDPSAPPRLAIAHPGDDAPPPLAMRLEPLEAVALYGLAGGTKVLLAWPAGLPASGCGRCPECTAFAFRGGKACLIPSSAWEP